jgi:OmpA-OmpF porin, OOP family
LRRQRAGEGGMTMTHHTPTPAPGRSLALLLIGSALLAAGCSHIPRDIPASAEGLKPEATVQRAADLQARLNALRAKDPARFGPIEDADLQEQGKLIAIQDPIRRGSASEKYDWSKAQCWVRNAYSERAERDARGFPAGALDEAEKIVKGMESGGNTYKGTALINHTERVRPDLWARAEKLKTAPGYVCAAHTVGCLEVQLSRSGHELTETGWRHANSYIAIAEDMTARAEAQAAACPAEPVVAAAPPPAPVVAPPPPPPPAATVERVSLAADALFRFDRSGPQDLLPKGRAQLDELAAKLAAGYARIDRISLIGHTDRLGSDAYNDKLSLARANTVRAYLQGKGVTAPMTTAGRGKREQVEACKGVTPRAKLIDCLQPNRRVEVLIEGVRTP